MMAREINNLLQSEYVDTGIVDFNFHCSVFDEGIDIILLPFHLARYFRFNFINFRFEPDVLEGVILAKNVFIN